MADEYGQAQEYPHRIPYCSVCGKELTVPWIRATYETADRTELLGFCGEECKNVYLSTR